MRGARDNGILKSDNGKLVGINLGADYCAEHEWGIKKLRSLFKVSEQGYGLDKRTATHTPENVYFRDNKNETILIVGAYEPEYKGKLDLNRFQLYRGDYNKDKLATAWDEGSFGIHAVTPEHRQAVRDIHEAIQTKNLALWLGGGGVFQNAGLVLAIKSNIPESNAQQLREADIDREKLLKAAEETGIAAKLEKAGRRYFALSPSWNKSERKTKHPVIFWLNPMEQRDNAYGWFTVEDLELWAIGKGPVIENSDTYKQNKGRK